MLYQNTMQLDAEITETKLYLIWCIKRQIKELINKLKPILNWRILVERDLLNIQSKKKF